MKKIYVGMVLADYSTALCIGLDKQKVEEKMESYELERTWWIDEYNLDEDKAIELYD